MKKVLAVIILGLVFLSEKSFAASGVEVVDKGWNRINLGVLFPDWAKSSCEIYSLKNAGWWVSNKILNSSQIPLYARCIEKRVVTAPTPSPTPVLVPSPGSCDRNNFKVAFILLVKSESEATDARLAKLSRIKERTPELFNRATSQLARVDSSYPVKVVKTDLTYVDTMDVGKKFYETNNDAFNFLVFFTAFNPGTSSQFYARVKNEVQNIGLPVIDASSQYGSGGNLLGIVNMGFIDNYDTETVYTYNGIFHEMGHQWCCGLGQDFDPNNLGELPILQSGKMHMYIGLSSLGEKAGLMGQKHWVPNGDGTFRRDDSAVTQGDLYQPFDLYFMGLVKASDITQTFALYNAGVSPNFNNDRATFVRNIGINDLINFGGERKCL